MEEAQGWLDSLLVGLASRRSEIGSTRVVHNTRALGPICDFAGEGKSDLHRITWEGFQIPDTC